MKMFIKRIGEGQRMIVKGDKRKIDLKKGKK